MINTETKCRDCGTPINPDGIITTSTAIDFSQIKTTECPQCGCKWTSVRVTKEEIPILYKRSNTVSRYFLDCEFIDTGSTIDLISIGIVCNDGRELYLQSVEFDPEDANDWVKKNVFPHLLYCSFDRAICGGLGSLSLSKVYHQGIVHDVQVTPMGQCDRPDCPWRTRLQIKNEVLAFINEAEDDGIPEFIGWCASYDFVALCQLFGTMMDLPSNFPHYIKDFQQVLDDRGISDDELPEQENGLHHALSDARHLKQLWGYIVRNDAWQ